VTETATSGCRPHIAVIGGGITGLAAMHTLLRPHPRSGGHLAPRSEGQPTSRSEGQLTLRSAGQLVPRLTLVEADSRLGGKIRSEPIASQRIDVGAESLMARAPAAIELCRELGLERELIAAQQTTTAVWARGGLRELPPGILGGLPDGVGPVLRSGILSPAGLARAALDLLLPRCDWRRDEAVGEIVRRRLGSEALDRLIDPLLGTIYAADCEQLSARATAPQIDRLARAHRSLIRGLRSAESPPPSSGPLFVTLPRGLERIVDRLAERISAAELRLGVRPGPLERTSDGRYALSLSDGSQLRIDGVLIATPADEAAAMLSIVSPLAAMHLRSIRYSSTVVVTLRFPASALSTPPHTAGVLVPAGERIGRRAGERVGRRARERMSRPAGERPLLGACTSLSTKWPHLAEGGEHWLRCSVARGRNAAAMEMRDGALVDQIAAELQETIGLAGRPLDAHVTRWERSLPIYRTGHLERVEHIEGEIERLSGLELAGAAYRGIGVPQCIAQGRAAAQRLLEELGDAARRRPSASPTLAPQERRSDMTQTIELA
jgi:protoporphyrinogen/coproporphyrinogen III oxidase